MRYRRLVYEPTCAAAAPEACSAHAAVIGAAPVRPRSRGASVSPPGPDSLPRLASRNRSLAPALHRAQRATLAPRRVCHASRHDPGTGRRPSGAAMQRIAYAALVGAELRSGAHRHGNQSPHRRGPLRRRAATSGPSRWEPSDRSRQTCSAGATSILAPSPPHLVCADSTFASQWPIQHRTRRQEVVPNRIIKRPLAGPRLT